MEDAMYRYSNGHIRLSDFKQPLGIYLNWVKKAQTSYGWKLRRSTPLCSPIARRMVNRMKCNPQSEKHFVEIELDGCIAKVMIDVFHMFFHQSLCADTVSRKKSFANLLVKR